MFCRVYIRNAEREQLSEQALSLCIQTLRLQIKNVTSSNCPKLLGDIFKVYQRSQKSLVYKESLFAEMLIEVYKKYMGEKLPENVNVLDMAIKYCQQNKSVEKLKRQQIINVLPRNPILTTAVRDFFLLHKLTKQVVNFLNDILFSVTRFINTNINNAKSKSKTSNIRSS